MSAEPTYNLACIANVETNDNMLKQETMQTNLNKGEFNPQGGVVTLQLHGVSLVDKLSTEVVDNLLKTYNSASRCAYKRFEAIGLKELLKAHRVPNKRKFMSKFRNVPMVDGKPMCYDCPTGMSESTWTKMREESYKRKALAAFNNANKFWQIDKDLGSPILGTESMVGEWAKSNGYELDSTLLHNAVLDGFRNYKSFERQKSKWLTSKETACFGDQVARSKKQISREEFELTRNSSLTVIGKKKVGNPKFKFDLENETMDFTFRRKKIQFSFKSHRFSKKGYKKFADLVDCMSSGNLAVTVTLTKVANGKFTISLAYNPNELKEARHSNVVTGIWVSDEVVHHQISRDGKVLHERTYRVEEFTRERKVRKTLEFLKYKGDIKTLRNAKRNLESRKLAGTRNLLNKIFNISHAYGSTVVVVEAPNSKTKRNFNNGFIGFDKYKVSNGIGAPCFIAPSRFVKMVQSQCIKNGMALKKVNGAFIQLNAVLGSSTMPEAIRKATSEMVSRAVGGQGINLTESAKQVIASNPSMLDWVGHLLHNKRGRQARCEVKKAFQSRIVEKAVRLLDKRHRRSYACLQGQA